MAINGIGSSNTYIYNTKTGKLATKDGSADDFVDYFNGDIKGELPGTLNGFDEQQKSGINNMLMLLEWGKLRAPGISGGQDGDEFEITSDVVDASTTHFSINGERVLTAYDASAFTYIDHIMAEGLLYGTQESKGYDPSDNSVNIAVGDVFDLGNGYRLIVKEDSIWVDGTGSGNEEKDHRAKQLAYGLNALIRFADKQWMPEKIDEESTPMLLSLLREMGVDTDREFQINGTKCEVRNGRIREADKRFVPPSSIVSNSVYNEALKKYEAFLYTPISERVKMQA